MKDYYKVLQVKKNATLSEIKGSYRKLKKEYNEKKKKDKLEELEKAYQVLSHKDSRDEYDKKKVTKEEVKENTSKKEEKKKDAVSEEKTEVKPMKVVLTILGIIALFGGLFLISEMANKGGKDESESHELTTISYSEFREYLDGSEKTVVMIGRPSCSWCLQYSPVLEKVSGAYNLDIKYLNTDDFTEEEYNHYLTVDTVSAEEGIGTPITLLIANGEIIDRIDGYVEQASVETFLHDNGLIS